MSYDEFENESDSGQIAIERRIKRSQMERNVRRTKLFIQQVRALFALALAFLICAGLYTFAKCHYWYLPSDVFFKQENNPRVKLEGNLVTSDKKIMEMLRRVEIPDLPIYLIDTREMENAISQLEPVKKVYIRRLGFPARFIIRVDERIPVLTISPNQNVPPIAFFTSCGKLISNSYMPLPDKFKTYLVLSYGIGGDDYYNWDITKVNSLVIFAMEIEKLSKEKVQYLDLRNPKDIYVKLETALVRIGEMDETVYDRIKNIGSILPLLQNLKDKKIKYIDLRWKTNYLKLDNSSGGQAHSIYPRNLQTD